MPKTGRILLCAVILFIVFYQFVPTEEVKLWALYALAAAGIPFIFELTRKNATDRRVGDFSYPIYISHLLMVPLVNKIALPLLHAGPGYLGFATVTATTIFSYLLLRFIADPIDTFRARRAQKYA